VPDFNVRLSSASMLTAPAWSDPATPSAPSRLNPRATYPHRYLRIAGDGLAVFEAQVGGVWGPLDAALGGRLFLASWVQWSGDWPAPIVQPAGHSARAEVMISTVHNAGYHQILFWRPSGGAIALPFNVEAP
jgi:hypothetical protein